MSSAALGCRSGQPAEGIGYAKPKHFENFGQASRSHAGACDSCWLARRHVWLARPLRPLQLDTGQNSRGWRTRVCFRLLLTEGLRRKSVDPLAPSIEWFTLLRYAFYKALLIFVTSTVASGGRGSNTPHSLSPSRALPLGEATREACLNILKIQIPPWPSHITLFFSIFCPVSSCGGYAMVASMAAPTDRNRTR